MAQTITRGFQDLLDKANSDVTKISVDAAASLLNSNSHIFIDLRDVHEMQRVGNIPGAFSCPRGMLEFWIDPASPYHKDIFNQDKTYVFYCASARQSALGAQKAQEMGLAPVVHIEGGFTEWTRADKSIETI